MYRPKDEDAIRTKQFGIKTVEEWGYVPYVFGQDFQAEYDLIKVYAHKCDHCGKRMHKANEEELSKLSCPYCGTEKYIRRIDYVGLSYEKCRCRHWSSCSNYGIDCCNVCSYNL